MIPLRLVLDTNIVVSAALKPDGLPRTVLLLALSKPARLYVTDPLLEEYREVLSRPELQIRRGARQRLLQLIGNSSRMVSPRRRIRAAVDPDDDKFRMRRRCPGRLPGHRKPAALSAVLENDQGDRTPRVDRHRCAPFAGWAKQRAQA